jgi:hypothetical protein
MGKVVLTVLGMEKTDAFGRSKGFHRTNNGAVTGLTILKTTSTMSLIQCMRSHAGRPDAKIERFST